MRYDLDAEIWLYQGDAAWHFITVPASLAQAIKTLAPRRSAFGSMRVIAAIGKTVWRTSLFPDAKTGTLLLPLKAEVRRKEKLASGDVVRLVLELDV